jgi:hypothetical protein
MRSEARREWRDVAGHRAGTACADGRGQGRCLRRALGSSRASLGHVSDCADLRPCPLNPGGVSHWPGGSASGSGRGFHATPNERPRPHHSVRILLTFWPTGQPRQRRSACSPPALKRVQGAGQLTVAAGTSSPAPAAGTGPLHRAAVGAAVTAARLFPGRSPIEPSPPARDFPGRFGEILWTPATGGVSVDARGQLWWYKNRRHLTQVPDVTGRGAGPWI